MSFSLKEEQLELKLSIMDDDLVYSTITTDDSSHYEELKEEAQETITKLNESLDLGNRMEELQDQKDDLDEEINGLIAGWG